MIVQRSTAYSPTPVSTLSAAAQQKRQETVAGAAMVAETVTISQTARDALAAESATSPADPLESYAIPSWEADLFPVELSGTLGAKASDVYLKGGNLVGKYDNELAEYGQRLDSHLRSLMAQEGINSTTEYHQAMVVDKNSSERLRLLLKSSIEGDQRMGELMSKLGVAFR